MRYDVWRTPSRLLVVELQHDFFDHFDTRVVAPLRPLGGDVVPARRLNPVVEVSGRRLFIQTQFLSSMPRRDLVERVGSVATEGDAITAALDLLFTGF